jgi:glycosyltransferase involved in cell wall biosynthesis
MAQGTGIASYGVALVAALHALGHQAEGVFGLAVPADEALRETVFFNAFKRPVDRTRKTNRYQRAWYFLRAFRRPRPRRVPLTTAVERAGFGQDMPAFDRLTSAGRLFDDAFTSFARTGRFVSLRLSDPPEVMHWTYPVPIRVEGSRNIYTLHDLVPLKLPYTTMDDKALYGRVVAECVRTAAQICTVSEASKRDIVERFGVDPARVTNTYQAATLPDDVLHADPDADARSVEGIFGLERRGYFLYFGAIEPKKNVGRLIEAYLSLQTKTPLVLVGARAWQSEQELRLMPDGGAGGAAGTFVGHRGQTIMRLDYLPRALLTKLIRGAKAVVFPSLYEGFGLPVLEAMLLGTPVITSTTSSLPEVAGDAALLVDPYDVGAIENALRQVDGDAALGQAMSARGLDQARLFAPERYHAGLAELYAAAIGPR